MTKLGREVWIETNCSSRGMDLKADMADEDEVMELSVIYEDLRLNKINKMLKIPSIHK